MLSQSLGLGQYRRENAVEKRSNSNETVNLGLEMSTWTPLLPSVQVHSLFVTSCRSPSLRLSRLCSSIDLGFPRQPWCSFPSVPPLNLNQQSGISLAFSVSSVSSCSVPSLLVTICRCSLLCVSPRLCSSVDLRISAPALVLLSALVTSVPSIAIRKTTEPPWTEFVLPAQLRFSHED